MAVIKFGIGFRVRFLAESVLAESVLAESVLAESVMAESVLAESVLAESKLAESDANPVYMRRSQIRSHFGSRDPR